MPVVLSLSRNAFSNPWLASQAFIRSAASLSRLEWEMKMRAIRRFPFQACLIFCSSVGFVRNSDFDIFDIINNERTNLLLENSLRYCNCLRTQTHLALGAPHFCVRRFEFEEKNLSQDLRSLQRKVGCLQSCSSSISAIS